MPAGGARTSQVSPLREATAHKPGQEPFVATVSVGVAADHTSCDLAALIKMADGALYRAKQRGRNRVELADAPARAPAAQAAGVAARY